MKVCYRIWGYNSGDWACNIHPITDWKTVAADEFEAVKHRALSNELVRKIEWHPAYSDDSEWLVKGWLSGKEVKK